MNKDTRPTLSTASCVLWIAAVAVVTFAYSVHLRHPWFGTVGETYSAVLLNCTIEVVRNWYREGIWTIKAAVCALPLSIESPSLALRQVHYSYPPGCIIPFYAISVLLRYEPTVVSLQAYNLANHLAVALFQAWMVFAFLRQIRYSRNDACMLATIPLFLYLLLPSPLYNHQMRFWADHAIIIYFALYLLLEVLGSSPSKNRRWIRVAQGFLAFAGIFTDWFFAFVVPCVYLKRILTGEMGTTFRSWFRKSVTFWTPFALGLGLFALQLAVLGGFAGFWERLGSWSNPPAYDLLSLIQKRDFWTRHMVNGYGRTGIVLLAVHAAFLFAGLVWASWQRVRRRPLPPAASNALGIMFLTLLPGILCTLAFPRHAACPTHYFSTLKFGVPLAVGPLVLVPALVLAWFGIDPAYFSISGLRTRFRNNVAPPRAAARISLLSVVLVGAAVAYVSIELPRVVPQFTEGLPRDIDYGDVGEFLRLNTRYEDVLFTPNPALLDRGFLFLPTAMKAAYDGTKLYGIYDKVRDIRDPYVVNILRLQDETPPPGSDMARLLALSLDHRTWKGLQLDKIPKEWFLAFCRRENPQPPPKLPEAELKAIMELLVRRAAQRERQSR